MKKLVWGLAAVCTAVVLGMGGLFGLVGAAGGATKQNVGFGGQLSPDAPVPGWLRPLLEDAAGECPEVTVSLLGAQLRAESGFEPRAQSPMGARGIAQFVPATWLTWGRDGDDDGRQDVLNPRDAVPAAAAYDCALAEQVRSIPGDTAELMLAAYNAGPGAVEKYRAIPPFPETRNYVERIRRTADSWLVADVHSDFQGASRVVQSAKSALGSWYRWGGLCQHPFEGAGACDCSSLVKMAWAAGGVNLPRTTYDQVKSGRPVRSLSQLQPGDLLFAVGSASRPEHVAMYVGDEQVIDAPRTGLQVRLKPLSYWRDQVVAMRTLS